MRTVVGTFHLLLSVLLALGTTTAPLASAGVTFPIFQSHGSGPYAATTGLSTTAVAAASVTEDGQYLLTGEDAIIKARLSDGAIVDTRIYFPGYPGTGHAVIPKISGMTSFKNGVCFFTMPHAVARLDENLNAAMWAGNDFDNGNVDSSGLADGAGSDARFNLPTAITYGASNEILYVCDSGNHRVRTVTATTNASANGTAQGLVTSFVGGNAGYADHTNPALVQFTNPNAIAFVTINGVEFLYVGEDAGRIRRVTISTGATTTIVGTGSYLEGYAPETARISRVAGLAVRGENSLWVLSKSSSNLGVLSWNDDGNNHYMDGISYGLNGLSASVVSPPSGAEHTVYIPTGNVIRRITTIDTDLCPVCNTNRLIVDYSNTRAIDAAQDANVSIRLNTLTWEVEFEVGNVAMITNGHVIASKLNARNADVVNAIESYVSAPFESDSLWNNTLKCGLSGIDTPAASTGVSAQFNAASCTRSFLIKHSLIDAQQHTSHCTPSVTANGEILVECKLTLSTIRAMDLTFPHRFLTKESIFTANITIPNTIPNEVSSLLHASLAKCSVYATNDFYVDCFVPGTWNFDTVFSVTQTPDWIIASSCVQSNETDGAFIRCDLQSVASTYTELSATIGATVLPSGEVMKFAVNYSVPQEEVASASGSLSTFVKSIGTKNSKFFYGSDDLLTLEIEVESTSLLQITQLELFNSASPSQSYDLRSHSEFSLVEGKNATFFIISFFPARVYTDTAFYAYGPHGVNITFLFTADSPSSRRRQVAGDTGSVQYSGLRLKTPRDESTASGAATNVQDSATSTQTMIIVIVIATAILVVVVAISTVLCLKLRNASPNSQANPKESTKVDSNTECSQPTAIATSSAVPTVGDHVVVGFTDLDTLPPMEEDCIAIEIQQ